MFGGLFGGGGAASNPWLNVEPIPALTFQIPPEYIQVRRQDMVEEHRKERRKGAKDAEKRKSKEKQDANKSMARTNMYL